MKAERPGALNTGALFQTEENYLEESRFTGSSQNQTTSFIRDLRAAQARIRLWEQSGKVPVCPVRWNA